MTTVSRRPPPGPGPEPGPKRISYKIGFLGLKSSLTTIEIKITIKMANFLKIRSLFASASASGSGKQIRNFSNKPRRDFTNVYQAVIRRDDVDGLNRPVFYRDEEFKILPKLNDMGHHLTDIFLVIKMGLKAVTPYSQVITRYIGRSSLDTTIRQVGERDNRLTVFFQLPKLNVHQPEVELEIDSIVIIWKTLEPSPENDYWSKMVIYVPSTPKSLEKEVDDENLMSVTIGM